MSGYARVPGPPVTPKGTNVVDDAVQWIEPIAASAPIAQAVALEAVDRAGDVALEVGLKLEKVSYDKNPRERRSQESPARVRREAKAGLSRAVVLGSGHFSFFLSAAWWPVAPQVPSERSTRSVA
jgi:hypothetical protein